jgi:hypothetical protein
VEAVNVTRAIPSFRTLAGGSNSQVYVIFTDIVGTKRALTAASRLARGLDFRVTLLIPRIVPYPLPLERPPVPVDFVERRIAELVSGVGEEIAIEILLCRDRSEAFRNAFGPESLVVVGTGKIRSWLRYRNLLRCLKADGLSLILAD